MGQWLFTSIDSASWNSRTHRGDPEDLQRLSGDGDGWSAGGIVGLHSSVRGNVAHKHSTVTPRTGHLRPGTADWQRIEPAIVVTVTLVAVAVVPAQFIKSRKQTRLHAAAISFFQSKPGECGLTAIEDRTWQERMTPARLRSRSEICASHHSQVPILDHHGEGRKFVTGVRQTLARPTGSVRSARTVNCALKQHDGRAQQ